MVNENKICGAYAQVLQELHDFPFILVPVVTAVQTQNIALAALAAAPAVVPRVATVTAQVLAVAAAAVAPAVPLKAQRGRVARLIP